MIGRLRYGRWGLAVRGDRVKGKARKAALLVVGVALLCNCETASRPQSTPTKISPDMARAKADADRILSRVQLPPGSHTVEHLAGAQFGGGGPYPNCSPQTDEVRFWSLAGSIEAVEAFVKMHPTIGTSATWNYGSTPSNLPGVVIVEITGQPQVQPELLDITIGQIDSGHVGVRADAHVAPPSSVCLRNDPARS